MELNIRLFYENQWVREVIWIIYYQNTEMQYASWMYIYLKNPPFSVPKNTQNAKKLRINRFISLNMLLSMSDQNCHFFHLNDQLELRLKHWCSPSSKGPLRQDYALLIASIKQYRRSIDAIVISLQWLLMTLNFKMSNKSQI